MSEAGLISLSVPAFGDAVPQPITPQKNDRPLRRRNRLAREQALISAASRLFALKGYEATTTREIAAEAGCAEGLIHRYFNGKAGLLHGLIRSRLSREVAEISQCLRLSSGLKAEVLQLVNLELQNTWEDREFFQVVVPLAVADPKVGQVIKKIGRTQRLKAVAERLKRFDRRKSFSEQDRQALAHFIGVMGFMFGFVAPVILGDDLEDARKVALTITRMLARSL